MGIKEIEVDGAELCFIEASLSPTEGWKERSESPFPGEGLILKVGYALLESQKGVSVTLPLTEIECRILRERLNIYASTPTKKDLGLNLKVKIYTLLLEYNVDSQVGEVALSDHQESSSQEVRNALDNHHPEGSPDY